MGVQFRGGTSGKRGEDYLAPVPDSGHAQPVLNTETSASQPGVNFPGGPQGVHYPNPINATQDRLPDLPTGATNGSGTDIEDPDTPSGENSSMESDVFKGSPNTGVTGGPAHGN